MSNYILLLTLTPEGRERMLADAASLLRAEQEVSVDGVQVLGLYAVLGEYDFISIVEASDNETAARFSLELGVLAGAKVETLPAIPIARLDPGDGDPSVAAAAPVEGEAKPANPSPSAIFQDQSSLTAEDAHSS